MKKHKNLLTTCSLIIAILLFVFWYGGDAPDLRGWNPNKNPKADTTSISKTDNEKEIKSSGNVSTKNENPSPLKPKDEYMTDPVPYGNPLPAEPQDAVISKKELSCTLSVCCDSVFENIDWLDSEKKEIIPKDGIIFSQKDVTFYKGESVFDLLIREMKQNNIHIEFEHTPIYNSAYIEGIGNLYEFDCGELSGWMYRVNGWFPNYGCSRYQLNEGDKVEWLYTCNLGVDIGGYNVISGD